MVHLNYAEEWVLEDGSMEPVGDARCLGSVSEEDLPLALAKAAAWRFANGLPGEVLVTDEANRVVETARLPELVWN